MTSNILGRHVLALMCALALAACSGPGQLGGDPQLTVTSANELPPPSRADFGAASTPYYVGALDRLTIDVFGVDELSKREVQVDASGRISFPLAGIIDVSGLTPGEVEAELARRLQIAHVRDPQVTVNLKETVSQVFTIEGSVRKPGVYPAMGEMSLIRAIATAEGTGEFTRLEDVVVFRTVQGQRYAALYDLKAIRRGVYPDPEIYGGDVIMVGESRARRVFKDVLASVPGLVTPLILAIDRFGN
jgi:polysaccharide export outer membrane protein